jgi:hypothetical protein
MDGTQYRWLLEKQVRRCGAISEYLDVDCFKKEFGALEKIQLQRLLSVTSAIEDIALGKTVFDDYPDAEFL